MLTPMPTQITGAEFLAARKKALLADAPRVGKCGATILAADKVAARRILVVTTKSGLAVWARAFPNFSPVKRTIKIFGVDKDCAAGDVVIVSWGSVFKLTPHFGRQFDLIVLDESHATKNPAARRTQACFGWLVDGGRRMQASAGLVDPGVRTWWLTGTPMPHDPSDLYTTLRNGAPDRLLPDPDKGWPDVLAYDAFRSRYCVTRPKQLSNGRWIEVVVAGKNEHELRSRVGDFMLRRTQADVGIRPPVHELLPLTVTAAHRREIDKSIDQKRVLEEINGGDPSGEEITRLRRLTGAIKAHAVADAVHEEFDGGLDKLVLAYWHRDVGDLLSHSLAKFGVLRIDGSTNDRKRAEAEASFRQPQFRVFLAQLQAASEALDLSASGELWFVESSFTPSHMTQMASRISNVTQTRNTFVRLCTIANSVDEVLQAAVARLSFSINEVMK